MTAHRMTTPVKFRILVCSALASWTLIGSSCEEAESAMGPGRSAGIGVDRGPKRTTAAPGPRTLPDLETRVEALLLYMDGEEADRNGDLERKLDFLVRSRELDPECQLTRFEFAWTQWRLRRFEEAAETYRGVSGKDRAKATLWEAHSLLAAGLTEDAEKLYQMRALEQTPVLWAPIALPGEVSTGDLDRTALFWHRRAREQETSGVHHWMYGNVLANAKRWKDALEAYRKAIECSPEFVPARASLAMTYRWLGQHDLALETIHALCAEYPNAPISTYGATYIQAAAGNHSEAGRSALAHLEQAGRGAEVTLLVTGATSCMRAGLIPEGRALVDATVLGRASFTRAILGDSDEDVLRLFSSRRPRNELEHYALASSLYGYVRAGIDTGNPLALGATLNFLESAIRPTEADIEALGSAAKAFESSTDPFDLAGAFANQFWIQLAPYFGRALREAEAASHAGFASADVLRAAILRELELHPKANDLLSATLEEHPGATAVRLRLGNHLPLEEAIELIEAGDARDSEVLGLMARRAVLEERAGESERSAHAALDLISTHECYWDMLELIALELDRRGSPQRALRIFDEAHRTGRSPRGSLARALLHRKLDSPRVLEALIDAWRAAPVGSSEERRSLAMIRELDTSGHTCSRCQGGGTISVTSGTTGQFGSIQTYQETCPQCIGLGLWHSQAR